MVNYSKGIVYKLCCRDVNITDIYIGSTTNFTRRKSCHKSDCNNEKGSRFNLKVYQFIRTNGGWDNWTIVQIEEYDCSNKRELGQYERFHFEQLKPSLNCQIPSRTIKEWCVDKKLKEQVLCECGSTVAIGGLESHKSTDKHKLLMNGTYEKLKEQVVCECGQKVMLCGLNIHKSSKKHQNFITSSQVSSEQV